MYKKISLLVTAILIIFTTTSVFAAVNEMQAAQNLHSLGLFMGVGTNADGSPRFELERQPNRMEALTMFVRLVGGAEEAHGRVWDTPFTDVPLWGLPYAGYAWHHNLTAGVSATRFDPYQPVTAAQYITFVLRALGYSSDGDFNWDSSWTLSDAKGITGGRFNAGNNHAFTRGDLAWVSFSALNGTFSGSNVDLAEMLINQGVFTRAQAQAAGVGEGAAGTADPQPGTPVSVTVTPATGTIGEGETLTLSATVLPQGANQTVTWTSSNTAVATVSAAGVVTGRSQGTAVITATTVNGLTATSTVTVSWRIPQSAITLPNRRLTEAERAEWIREYDQRGGAYPIELEIIRLTNIERAAHGLAPVAIDDNLMMAARFYSQTLGNLSRPLGHNEGPYGGSAEVARVFGAEGTWRNGHGGINTPQAVFDGWMNSPGHRANILQPNVRFIGVGSHVGGQGANTRSNFHYMMLSVNATRGTIAPTSVAINPATLTLIVGATHTLTTNLQPANATTTITWTSSNENVATVSATGLVRARVPGTTTITARTANNLTATLTVTVTVAPTSITVAPTTLNLSLNATHTLTATILPANAANAAITWTSSNANVATVSATGVVTGRAAGTAVITARTANNLTATVTVTVGAVAPTSITLSPSPLTLSVGAAHSLTANLLPANAATTITWTSSNANVATVSATGVVTAVAPGTAIITARTANNLTATVTVTVTAVPTNITLSPSPLTLTAGAAQALTANLQPANAATTITWTSSNANVATVSATGVVTAQGLGSAIITARTANNLTATVTVTVTAAVPTNITLSPSAINLNMGATQPLTANLQPANVVTTITWTSNNTNVATVSTTGVVTAVAPGTAIITARTANNLTAAANVTVAAAAPASITLSHTNVILTIGGTQAIIPTVLPAGANATVTWTSNDASVATVSPAGVITAHAIGPAIITATTVNNLTATVNVTVEGIMPTGITVAPASLTLEIGTPQMLTATVQPGNAVNTTVAWTSNNPSVATVSPDGMVTGITPGSATITASTVNNHTFNVPVTVNEPTP